METKPKALLEPSGRIILTGPNLAEFLTEINLVELWHSPTNKGLALHFLPEASPSSRPLTRGENGDQIVIEAADFLEKVGFGLPGQATELSVGVIDSDRMVISLSLEKAKEGGGRFAPGEVLAGLED